MNSIYNNDSEVYIANSNDALTDFIESLVNIIIDLLSVDTTDYPRLANSIFVSERDPSNWTSFVNAIGKSRIEGSPRFSRFNTHSNSHFTTVSVLGKVLSCSRVGQLHSNFRWV